MCRLNKEVVDSVVVFTQCEARQHNVGTMVGAEGRAAVPHLLPGEVLQGGEFPPHPANAVAVEHPSQGSQLLLVRIMQMWHPGEQAQVTENHNGFEFTADLYIDTI